MAVTSGNGIASAHQQLHRVGGGGQGAVGDGGHVKMVLHQRGPVVDGAAGGDVDEGGGGAGIDGGGTKTACVLTDEEGRLLGTGIGGPSNYLYCGKELAAESVRTATEQAFKEAGLEPQKLDAAYMASAAILLQHGDAHVLQLPEVGDGAIHAHQQVVICLRAGGEGAFPIHREPPKFEDLATSQEVLFTGIKVIDLLEPYLKGGKIAVSAFCL